LRRRDRSKPFFLFASFVRPHSPFDAPQHYFDLYNRINLTPPPVGDWADSTYETQGKNYNGLYMSPDPELLRQAQVGYYACITHTDHQIGRLIQALTDDGELNDTFIIFTSDHGELLGDHHLFRKSLPYEGSARIPLIIQPHRGFELRRGTTFTDIAELRDIMPTLLDTADAEIPQTVDGVSLLNVIKNNAKTREYLHGEHIYGNRSNHYIVTETDKYIWFSQTGQEQYFDLESDPKELITKINDNNYTEKINRLRNLLIHELTGRPEGYSDGERLISGMNFKATLF